MVTPRTKRQRRARVLRRTRRLHRWSGLTLMLCFVVVGVTSVLLGWKKESAYLQPPTQRSTVGAEVAWLPVEELLARAREATLREGLAEPEIDRLDLRPDRGVVKVRFSSGDWEIQLDGRSGAVLSVGKRRSDLIERIHDGSVLGGVFKLVYSTVLGLSLLVFTASGFWLWYGPRRMRRS